MRNKASTLSKYKNKPVINYFLSPSPTPGGSPELPQAQAGPDHVAGGRGAHGARPQGAHAARPPRAARRAPARQGEVRRPLPARVPGEDLYY